MVCLQGLARIISQVHKDEGPKEESNSSEVGGAGREGLGLAPGRAYLHDGHDDEQVGNQDDRYTSRHDKNGEHNNHHLLGVAFLTSEF